MFEKKELLSLPKGKQDGILEKWGGEENVNRSYATVIWGGKYRQINPGRRYHKEGERGKKRGLKTRRKEKVGKSDRTASYPRCGSEGRTIMHYQETARGKEVHQKKNCSALWGGKRERKCKGTHVGGLYLF